MTIRVEQTGAAGVGAPANLSYVTVSAEGTLSAERVLTGTANQVIVTDDGADTTVTLSTPQDIDTGADVTFGTLSLVDDSNQIILDSDGANTGTITIATLTSSQTWTFPDQTGTIALLTDIQETDTRHFIAGLMGG